MANKSPPEWQITTEPDRDRTEAILTACRCGAQATFENLYASTPAASRPPLSYCLYLATTVSQWPPLVAYILSLDTSALSSWSTRQTQAATGRDLPASTIQEYVVFSILSSVAKGDTAIVQTFLDTGLDQNNAMEYAHDRASSLLERAIMTNQMTMARFLLARGADANACALESEFMPCTMVSSAVSHNLPGMLRLLVSEGRGNLAGSWALWRAAEIASIDIAETLLDLGGININEVFIVPSFRRTQPADNWGTALHAAVTEDKIKFVEWLLRKGIDPNLKDGLGRKAIDLATQKGHLEIREVLNDWVTTHT